MTLFQPDQSPDLAGLPVILTAHPHVVVLGASAGGLRALSLILTALPADFPAPIVIVLHLSPDFRSEMAAILSRCTSLLVKEAQEGDCLQVGHVYVAPPGKHLCRCLPQKRCIFAVLPLTFCSLPRPPVVEHGPLGSC